jgi:hypothetical protein
MDLLDDLRRRCTDLADFIADVMEAPLSFDAATPSAHSATNHKHLWKMDYFADGHHWLDLRYRTRVAEAILARWRERLLALPEARHHGFRLYLYEDFTPTVTVAADTPEGCPFTGLLHFVETPRGIMEKFDGRTWGGLFPPSAPIPSRARLLEVVKAQGGSVGRATARALGLGVGAVRVLIEQDDLVEEVNRIRRDRGQEPARFRERFGQPDLRFDIYEEVIPRAA